MTPPSMPNAIKKRFFTNFNFQTPYPRPYCTQICSKAGKIKPSIDRQNEPTSDKKSDKSGIATAKQTAKYVRDNKFNYRQLNVIL